jgi:hypothetical protein
MNYEQINYSKVGLHAEQRQLTDEYEERTEEHKMPEIKEIPFLKGDEIGTEMVITFLSPHEEISKEETGLDRDTAQIHIELANHEKRIWTMNKTAQRMLAGLLGSNSDAWPGKTATLYTLEQNVLGKMKKVIYVREKQA